MKKSKYITPVSQSDDPDLQGAPAAMMRALKRAHKIAHDTNTGIVIMRDGEVVEVPPDPELYNDVPSVSRVDYSGGGNQKNFEGLKG